MSRRFGATWWGRRWIATLEALGVAYQNRLPRGRTYARRGAVGDLEVTAGRVTARVAGTRARPYRVSIELPAFKEATWQVVTAALAEQVGHAAALLEGRMPDGVDRLVGDQGVYLFPGPGELATSCSCPDWANPCKHVAAVHYVLADRFDADPFLLLALRGRDQRRLLAGIRAARAGVLPAPGEGEGDPPPGLADLEARALYTARGDLAEVELRPGPPALPRATLRRLGPPPGPAAAAAEDLERVVAGAAGWAWDLLSGAGREEPLLALLRVQGSSSGRELADATGRPIAAVRAELHRHMEAGLVRRTGRGPGTRYHPVTCVDPGQA